MWGRSLWLALPLILSSSALAEDLLVPDQFATIQAAIASAEDGDRVLVTPHASTAEGYSENLVISGMSLTLESASEEARVSVWGAFEVIDSLVTGGIALQVEDGAEVEVIRFLLWGSIVEEPESLGDSWERINGAVAALCSSSSVTFSDCLLRGGRGGDSSILDRTGSGAAGLQLENALRVEVTDSLIQGGEGGDWNIQPSGTIGGGGGNGGAALWCSDVGLLRIRSSEILGGDGGVMGTSSFPSGGGDGGHGIHSVANTSQVISETQMIGGDGGHGGWLSGSGGDGLRGESNTHVCISQVTAQGGEIGVGMNPGQPGVPFSFTEDSALGWEPALLEAALLGQHAMTASEELAADHNADGLIDVGDLVRVGLLDE
jgi:hypothetical protein